MRSAFFKRMLPVALILGAFSWTASAQFTSFTHVGGGATGFIVTNLQNGSYTFEGGGNDIWSGNDEFDYAHFEATNDFDVRVRVESLEFTATWTKAGLMARETFANNSRMAFNRVTPLAGANDTRFAYRTGTTSGPQGEHEDHDGSLPTYAANPWLRLQRVGNVMNAYRSTNGAVWILNSSQDTALWEGGALPAELRLGFAVSRHSGSEALATAQFRDFGSPSNAIQIGQQPVSQSIAAGSTATFSITIPGGYDFATIQWFTNGVPIPGANSPSYTTPALTLADNGKVFSAAVSNIVDGTTAVSANAVLTVFDYPILTGVTTLGDPNGVYVAFSKAMDGTVVNPANYTITRSGTPALIAPGDPVVGVVAFPGSSSSAVSVVGTVGGANNYPTAESPSRGIDGVAGTKYLNFTRTNVGVIITRGGGAAVVEAIQFRAANDAPGRDPMIVSVEGTTATDPTSAAASATWTSIYNGPSGLGTDPGRNNLGAMVSFANSLAFNTYRILVVSNRGDAIMQFSEVQLLSTNGAVTISGVTQVASNAVRLAVSTLTYGSTYSFSVANVQDAAANIISPNPSVTNFVHGANVSGPQGLTFKRYDGTGDWNANLAKINSCTAPSRNDPKIPTMEYTTSEGFNITGEGNTENYGMWIRGLFVPPVTGNYRFGIASDDRGELYISTDERPANKVLMGQQLAWAGGRNFTDREGTALPLDDQPFIGRVTQPIRMIAGRSYYMEGIVSEGTGGDHLTIAVQKPGDPQIGTGGNVLGIPRSLFSTNYEVGCPPTAFFRNGGPVSAVNNGNQTVTEGDMVDFVVTADGTAPYSYQWFSNGVAIAGATQPSISFRPIRTASGAQFYAVVSNPFSSTTSAVATLTVNDDVTAPIVRRAVGDGTFTNVTVEFSEPIDPATATEVSNFTITNSSGGVLTVHSASIRHGTNAVLRTDVQTPGERYGVVVNNVGDAAGVPNPVAANSTVVFTAWVFAPGYALMELYQMPPNLGNAVTVLTSDPKYPFYANRRHYVQTPDSRVIFPNDVHEYYGGRISGHFIPAVSQNYTFRVSNDDDAQLNGSLSEYPADKQTIINAPCCNGAFGNASPAIPLTAGNRYFYELLWKEGTGGDYGRLSIDGTTTIPSTLLGVYANPDNISLVLTQHPLTQTRAENQVATLTVGASLTIFDGASRSISYQWMSNGVDILGATGRVYNTALLSLANDGDSYAARVWTPGANLVSSNAVISVIVDTNGPVLNSVRTDQSFRTITLNWDEPVLEGAATEFGNYYILDEAMNQITVVAVDYGGSNVVLHLDTTLQEASTYSLEIDFQTDPVGNPTIPYGMPVIDPNGIVTNINTFVVSRGFARFDAYTGLTVPNSNDPLQPAILNNPVYPNSPTFFFYSNQVNWPQSAPNIENYAMRWTFWFTAPTTGTYKFEPSHDDGVNIYIATNGIPSTRVSVYHQDCCSGFGAGEGGYSIDMVAGQRFYIEEIVLEAGGGDYAGLSVTLPGGQYLAPIPAAYISQIVDPSLGASNNVGISQQPQDQTVLENGSATFGVVVTNPGPWGATYQWQADSGSGFTDIVGATASSYNTGQRQLSDNGTLYRVKVFVLGKTLTSSNALLTVLQDIDPPSVLAARTVRKHDAVIVNFSELVDAASATTLANYSLVDSNNAPVALSEPITLRADGKSVRIPSAALSPSSFYTLSVQNVKDLVNLTMVPTNVTFQTWVWSYGIVNFEAFLGLTVPDYQNPQPVIDVINSGALPTFEYQTNFVNWPQSAPDLNNYGMHFFGVFRAPITGSYKFEPAHDDSGNLLLSPDTNASNAVVVMDFDCCSGFGAGEGGYTANLVAGQGYYFDLRVVEAGGGDYAGLSVTLPNGAVSFFGGPYLAPIPAPFLETLADPVGASITITQQPQSMLYLGGSNITLTVGASAATTVHGSNPPRLYQWQRLSGGVWRNILGANGSSYTTVPAQATVSDYRVLIHIPGASAASAAATVTAPLVINWAGEPQILQQADNITGPWTDIPGASNPYIIDTTLATQKFYRQKPAP